MARPLVTLTTDFGLDGSYVAQMKGALLSVAGDAHIVDLCHTIRPQDIRQAARFVHQAIPWFPAGSIHVVVVDPGVGTPRPILVAQIDQRLIVAPDNGIVSGLWNDARQRSAVVLDRSQFWHPVVSPTFHGRDIMAPVAGHLTQGTHWEDLGTPTDSIVELEESAPTVTRGEIRGQVADVDPFGNLITNIHRNHLPKGVEPLQVACADQAAIPMVRTYGDVQTGALVALWGSSGWLEIAVRQGCARDKLRVGPGAAVIVKLAVQ